MEKKNEKAKAIFNRKPTISSIGKSLIFIPKKTVPLKKELYWS